jgi:UDP-glucose 4-epimerase
MAVFYKADIRDKKKIDSIFSMVRPRVVFHLAAQVDVTRSTKEPYIDAEINIIGSLNILEACRLHGVKKIVYSNSGGAGSGEPQYLPIDEEHPIEPMAHYGASKHTVEHYLKIYSGLYGVRFTSLRYANIYGPRQDPYGEGGVVAIFANKMLNGTRPAIFGDGYQTRDFTFVEDVARANLLSIGRADGRILNIGTGRQTSVNVLFRMIKKIIGSSLDPVYAGERKGEIRKSVLGIGNAKKALGWAPETGLEEGVRKTVAYFRRLG